MKADVLVFLAIDLALLSGVFLMLVKIHSRLERLEKRLYSRSSSGRQKKPSIKKDSGR